ncbi:MAG: amino acid permease [Candidatus Heimdallarchaeota archaeon]|nr:amino acid permease [Candidatus Heimdallarchaeota archaeon]MCK5142181.1 amino acid permease [Candidatus Heimdallarchaeota archaeon]
MAKDQTTDTNDVKIQLSKELGLKEALGIAVGALIGGGVFSVLGIVINNTGPMAFLSFILAGIVSSFTAYSYVHLALRYPKAGGAFIYAQQAFKKKWFSGFLGIILWFGYTFSISLYAMTFGRYLGEVLPIFGEKVLWEFHPPFGAFDYTVTSSAFIYQLISILLFIGLNMLGVKESSRAQNLLVLAKVSILVFYIITGIFAVQKTNFSLSNTFGQTIIPVITRAVLIFVSMEGFEILSNSVEEMKNPERDLPIGMYLSIIIVLILYVSVAVITVGILGSDVGEMGEVILTHAARQSFLKETGAIIMAIAAIISAASAINATLMGSSRLSYMLSHERIIPKAFAKISPKTRVPMRAIIISGILSMIFVLLFSLEVVAMAASVIFMIIFGAVNASGIKLLEGKKRIVSGIGIILIICYWIIWVITFINPNIV